MTTFVDTSALYALLDRDDRNGPAAARVFGSLLERDRLVSHNYVLIETAALVHRRLGPTATRALLEDLVAPLQVTWVDEDIHRAAVAALLAAARRRISLVDWVSFEVMRRTGIEVAFAFDPDFAAHGFETVP